MLDHELDAFLHRVQETPENLGRILYEAFQQWWRDAGFKGQGYDLPYETTFQDDRLRMAFAAMAIAHHVYGLVQDAVILYGTGPRDISFNDWSAKVHEDEEYLTRAAYEGWATWQNNHPGLPEEVGPYEKAGRWIKDAMQAVAVNTAVVTFDAVYRALAWKVRLAQAEHSGRPDAVPAPGVTYQKGQSTQDGTAEPQVASHLPSYWKDAVCAKCLEAGAGTRWCLGRWSTHSDGCEVEGEHLHRTCQTCGYSWFEAIAVQPVRDEDPVRWTYERLRTVVARLAGELDDKRTASSLVDQAREIIFKLDDELSKDEEDS